jgi:radical SAM superfamily enzyme
MPNNGNTGFDGAAQLTADLVDHGHMPDCISDAVLETLIEMSAESQIEIWHRETGLSVASLAALYRLYDTGAGYRRSRLYSHYETERKKRERDNEKT